MLSRVWIATSTTAALALLPARASAHSPCPPEMAQVGESCVDRFEASLISIEERGSELGPWSPLLSPEGHPVKAVSRAGVQPQAYISYLEARSACTNAGKRLCRADEWVNACKGPERTRYPYGDVHVPNACIDTGRTALLGKLFPVSQMYSTAAMNDPRLDEAPNTVGRTGEAERCTNAYGVHDMVGNVHEWAEDGTFRGGYFLDTRINREGCDYVTTAHTRDYHDYSIGFRCCVDAGSIASSTVDASFYAQVAELAVGTSTALVAAR